MSTTTAPKINSSVSHDKGCSTFQFVSINLSFYKILYLFCFLFIFILFDLNLSSFL